MALLTATAQARLGLLGNPSDLYGGRGLGCTIAELGAAVTLCDAPRLELPNDLLRAGFEVFAARLRTAGIDPAVRPLRATLHSTIPFQAGLSGSSALLVAFLRAAQRWFGLPLQPLDIAELAWRAEAEGLGVRAGPLDRLVQAHDGLLAMDFQTPFAPGAVERLDPALLPPLLLAWQPHPGQPSGDVHAPVYARWQAGDAHVRNTMAELAANAMVGIAALRAGDLPRFRHCFDRNFDLRAAVFPIDPADRRLIDLGRRHGAAAKFPGSGGAVLFACQDPTHRDELAALCAQAGHPVLAPTVPRPAPRLRAVLLAAGFATRLHPLTLHTAKPLLQVGGQPLLSRLWQQVEATPHLADAVLVTNGRFHRDFVAWQQATAPRLLLQVVDDGRLTNAERLGAVRDLQLGLAAAASAGPRPDGYLVLACDNLFELDLGALVAAFAQTGHGQLVVREVPAPVPPNTYSEVRLDGPRVVSFREKPADPIGNLSAIAAYVLPGDLPERLAEYLAAGGNPDAPGHLVAWLQARQPFAAHRLTGRFFDIGSAADLQRARAVFGG
ncbi:MAG: NTP transferase domain-containing protein [Planctomycetes bacterium]|nr:NTP transferase domain-containing protein [Planctomycetota bacterium]